VGRTAEKPGQTVNIDIALVPVSHETEDKLPAVSCSSGKLVVEQPRKDASERHYPGRIFEQDALSYEDAMQGFISASEAQSGAAREKSLSPDQEEQDAIKAQKKALHLEELQLRNERREVRKQRAEEDRVWKHLKERRKEEKAHQPGVSAAQKHAQDASWKQVKQHRQEQQQRRQEENTAWRRKRRDLKERKSQLPIVTAWIAMLIIIDNCTRQCLGLPLFMEGPSITAALIVEALKGRLPDPLQFVITDRGPQFRADLFQEFLESQGITRVLIAKHRPQSNGIAERFVRTIKEWLHDKTWENIQELNTLIERFIVEYNDRPHQGLPITGLSPNEFANRLAGYLLVDEVDHVKYHPCH
jgi:transposase InsO family protein